MGNAVRHFDHNLIIIGALIWLQAGAFVIFAKNWWAKSAILMNFWEIAQPVLGYAAAFLYNCGDCAISHFPTARPEPKPAVQN